MPTSALENIGNVCQIKVTLLGTNPPIWRRLLVPEDLTLERLHRVIQAAMGWQDYHLHEFRIGKQRFGRPDPMAQIFGGPRTASEKTAHLSTVLAKVRAKAHYLYDFGDDWDHEILVESFWHPTPPRHTLSALRVKGSALLRIVAACPVFTACWTPSPIPNTSSTTTSSNGWGATLIRKPSP